MTVILYGILLAHLNAYKEQYSNVFITFAITYLLKRLIKTGGQKEHGDLIGLAGYSLTIGEFSKLLVDVKKAGFQGNPEEANKIVGGLLGKGIDVIKDLIVK